MQAEKPIIMKLYIYKNKNQHALLQLWYACDIINHKWCPKKGNKIHIQLDKASTG